MKIEFLLEEISVLSVDYIKLNNRKDFDKIVVKRNDIKSVNLQFKEISQKDLIIRVSFKTFRNDYIFKISDILIKTKEIILLGILNDPLGIYNQGYIDNFKLLSDKKEKIKWYYLSNRQKYYYLRCCALLSGVRDNIDNTTESITIDLSKVKTDLDVYYEIGKAFFKSYGYFGTEFHSFKDCLISIDESLKKMNKLPILKIKGYRNFEKYFSKNILFNDFYEEFKMSGFTVENI